MKHAHPSLRRKVGALLLGCTLLASASIALVPQPAYAGGLPVIDGTNLIKNAITSIKTAFIAVKSGITAANSIKDMMKEFGLDPAAWGIGNTLIQKMVNQSLQKALTGNNGAPSPVTNISKHMLDVGDSVADDFLKQLSTNGAVKSPFQSLIAQSVREDYFKSTGKGAFFASNPYTLSKECESKIGGKGPVSLDCFFSATQKQANNPLGADYIAKQELGRKVADAQKEEGDLLQQGNGFLPIRTGCKDKKDPNGAVSLSVAGVCLGNITTPGHILAETVNKALGSSQDRIVQADEFNEIIANFISSQLFGSGGLLGLGESGSGGSGRSALGQQADATEAANTEGTAANAALSFLKIVTAQQAQLSGYSTNIESIRDAATDAQSALVALGSCPTNANFSPDVTIVLTDYSTGRISSANTAVTSLNDIISSLQKVAQENDPEGFEAAQKKYETILKQSSFPTLSQVSEAEDDATPGPVVSLTTTGAKLHHIQEDGTGSGQLNSSVNLEEETIQSVSATMLAIGKQARADKQACASAP
ncbi:MAG: hypothetical protein ABA06_02845 [Parcubacteria bacterium C7867-001]|nr:MAG: hypothetical protein ABA06_02845 [Parcubacteria bacterium C7867-001]